MTPEELDLIRQDADVVRRSAEEFSSNFYDALFEIDPATRQLFPDDLVEQRGKLVDELTFLVDAASAYGSGDDAHDRFLSRARELGRRHAGYGVRGSDYPAVGDALIASLHSVVDDWDQTHHHAWITLFRLISDVMREGASQAVAAD